RLGWAAETRRLVAHPLRRHLGEAAGSPPRQAQGGRLGGEAGELNGEPGKAEDAQRVAGEALRSGGPEDAPGEVGEAAVGIGDRTAPRLPGDGVDGEVAAREVRRERCLSAIPEIQHELRADQSEGGELLSP